MSVKKVNELSLFSLYGVCWSHVVAGDVTFLSGVDGASLPPVAFTRAEEKSGNQKHKIRTQKKSMIEKYTYTKTKTGGLKEENDTKVTRSHYASFKHVSEPSPFNGGVVEKSLVEEINTHFSEEKVTITQYKSRFM